MRVPSRAAADLLRARLGPDAPPPPEQVRSALGRIPEDERDRWVDALLDIDAIAEDDPDLPRGCVPYLPCPASTVLEAVERAEVSADDVVVDVGAGVGRTLCLMHWLTGASGIGIEIQPRLIELAIQRAAWASPGRLHFIRGDAAEVIRSVTTGTVFFLYCPFGSDRLRRFLDGLEDSARARAIRVCCVDMAPLDRPWLTPVPSGTSAVDLYRSR